MIEILNRQLQRKLISFFFFRFGDIQLLDIMNYLGGATSIDSFLKAYQTKKTNYDSANYETNLIKSYLIPILVNDRDFEPTVTKKANQFLFFRFGDIQLLDIMNYLGGATSIDSFLKAYQTKKTKDFLRYE